MVQAPSPMAGLPGLYFTRAAREVEASPLRSDVAGFAGRARRGPLATKVRVQGWKDVGSPGTELEFAL